MKLALVIIGITILMSGTFSSMFSSAFASTSSELFIVSSDSGAEVKTMELKAINENGEVRMVSDFTISTENVVSVEPNGKVTVFSAPTSPTFTSAKITDTNDRIVEIPVTDTGVISLAGYGEGVYTLDVIVDDRYAFESIVVIGSEEGQDQQQIINNHITKVNNNRDDPWKKGINKERVCLFNPSDPICKPINGKCDPGWSMNEDGQCFPRYRQCPPGYWRADDDESGACVPQPVFCIDVFPPPPGCPGYNPELINGTLGGNVTVNGTSLAAPGTNATEPISPGGGGGGGGDNQTLVPEPPLECPAGEQLAQDGLSCEPTVIEEPTPIICGEGEELVDGQCQIIPTEEDSAVDEEGALEPEENGGEDTGDDTGDEGGVDEGDEGEEE
jgi:hypothetical protein